MLAVTLIVMFGLMTQLISGQVLGVDLSAENIKVAAVRPGNPFHIVIDEQAKRKIPLAISFDDGQRHFGNNAVGFALRKPLDTYLYAQRLLGQTVSSNRLEQLKDSFAYNFVAIPGRGTAVGIESPDGSTIFSPEELIAMSLEHVLKIAIDDGNVGVKDVVITVPHWFTAIEKEALLQAAELAGMSVMSLITDTGASSIQYGLDRTFENTNDTTHVCIVDVGASGTELSYIQFQGVRQRTGPTKIAGHANVMVSYSDETIGGHFMDKLLREHFLTMIDQQLKKDPSNKITIDEIRKQPRAMAKLLKQAQGVKTILSANQEAKIHVESVYKDIDLSGTIRRAQFEELLQPQLLSLDNAVQTFKSMLPPGFKSFDDIVIVGGASRVPILQQSLKESFQADKLSQTLNGDEAMVMGAVFVAANQSISFQVRPFLFTDNNNGDVHIHIHDEPLTINTAYPLLESNTEGSDEEGDNNNNSNKVPGKHVVLFPKNSPINKRKTLTLTRKDDMIISVNYDSKDVCNGCHAAVKGYTVNGITALYDEHVKSEQTKHEKEIELGVNRLPVNNTYSPDEIEQLIAQSRLPPKGLRISLTFTTAETTIPRLLSAEALIDDWVIIDETAELTKNAKKNKKAKKQPKETTNNSTDSTEAQQEDGEKQPQAEEEQPPKQTWRVEKRIKRTPLTFTTLPFVFDEELNSNIVKVSTSGVQVNGFIPMSKSDFALSKEKLATFAKNDNARRELAAARNSLESLIYQVRNDLDDEIIITVTTEEQRTALMSLSTDLNEWLDTVGDDFSTNDGSISWFNDRRDLIRSKTDELSTLLKPVLYRKSQLGDRESTFSSLEHAFTLLFNSTETFRTSKPWVTEQLDDIDQQAKQLQQELTDLYNEQLERDQSLDPVWKNEVVVSKFTTLTDLLKKASKVPKPKPPKVETTSTTDEDEQQQQQSESQTNGDDDANKEQNDEEQPQQTQQDDAQDNQDDSTTNNNDDQSTKSATHDEL